MDGSILSPSTLSSSSNASSSPVTIRGDGISPYGSNISSSVIRLPTDDELQYEGVEKLIKRLRTLDSEHKKLLMEHSRVMKDVNRRLQVHIVEVRSLRDMNQKLQQEKDCLTKEKDELGGMCCFLDDDREKAKKMAREWQVFGRYATGVLQKELSQCHSKIRDLEQKQQSLLVENRSLKELCLLLDQEQAGSRTSLDSQNSIHGAIPGLAGTRDSGDGSSNASTASNCSPDHRSSSGTFQKESSLEGRENYVRYLENKIRQFEVEAKGRLKKISSTVPTHSQGILCMSPGKMDRRMYPSATHLPLSTALSPLSTSSVSVHAPAGNVLGNAASRLIGGVPSSTNTHTSSSGNPGAFVHAMKALDLHDRLDDSLPNSMYQSRSTDGSHLDEQHKEIVREMCNVVWRKLSDSRGSTDKPAMQSRTLQHRSASMSNL